MLLESPSWFETAACLGKDDLFFSSSPNDRKKAAKVCETCPHTVECFDYAKLPPSCVVSGQVCTGKHLKKP